MTRRELILDILSQTDHPITCAEICQWIEVKENLTASIRMYLSGSVSSLLRKMVIKNQIKIASLKGPKGGQTYKLAQ